CDLLDEMYASSHPHKYNIADCIRAKFGQIKKEDVRLTKRSNSKTHLTHDEKTALKVLNFIAEFDGIITSEDDIKILMNYGIEKFISKRRQYLVSLTNTAYPVKIKTK